MVGIIVVPMTFIGTHYIVATPTDKRYISTQLDRYVPEKFTKNHKTFTAFIKYFLEFIEEYKQANPAVDITWSAAATYAVGNIVWFEGLYYKCLAINVNNQPDIYTGVWEYCYYETAGVYEHITNMMNYMNIDFVTDKYVFSDRQWLYLSILNKMLDEQIYDKKIQLIASGLHYMDMIFLAKKFNTEKGTVKGFERAANYAGAMSPTAEVCFGETSADIIAALTWVNTTAYSVNDSILWGAGTHSYKCLIANTGVVPGTDPLTWSEQPPHMIYDVNLQVPMEYGERFRYWINSNDFKINQLIRSLHPAGYFLEFVYFPIYAVETILPCITRITAGIGSGIISGTFDYSTP